MKRNTRARVLAVAALLGALAAGSARKAGWFGVAIPAAVSDEDAISASLFATMKAARAGDIGRYLGGYTGPMRVALQRTLDDAGRAGFARYLESLDAGVKGVAISVEVSGGREGKARMERVYRDRNDVQVLYLKKDGGNWRIARTEGDQTVRAAIPYGTPIR